MMVISPEGEGTNFVFSAKHFPHGANTFDNMFEMFKVPIKAT